MLDAWRARGEDRVNPVRYRFIEALTRRAALHEGEARRIIDARLSTLLTDYADTVAQAMAERADDAHAQKGPLATLLDDMALHAATHPSHEELLEYMRGVWSKVSAERQLRESQQKVPKNAGPLNSNSLVHRSLALMREASPEYLQHFLAYVETLSWMEEMTGANAPAAKDAPRARKPARGRSAS
ncbi:DUF2894 domain-containing protein [Caballeronia sp. LZ062]|uniref:DUF2894 domain-containing protein n=1 Tax=unclassified Caballeronia TaxID=2646786 RepID=UPI002854415B|nr:MULTISPECIES: DUF2894 domain-containing protein [unclassified Caballeronia]MDR5856105.1 DUF2894 domain-containing protein [Caballeronia sp. LZ050]MDR5872776.1 DUF2894 domain-containing protein [Caballeronia sp. LZ062]